jgi:hypothetical protein
MAKRRDNSLQNVLRARRDAKPLLTPHELRLREAARRREEEERRRAELASEAARLVERWRERGKRVDSEGRLATDAYREIFGLDPDAYAASAHWYRRVRAQLAHAAACEVERCGRVDDLGARHLQHDTLGEERAGRDLVTVCGGCARRARRRERELGRALSHDELRALDPEAPLFDRDAIAALKARYARPLRRSDL